MNQDRSKARIATTVAAIVAVIGIVVLIEYLQKKQALPGLTASGASSMSTSSQPSNTSNSTYKDGTYTADSNYYVPHGNEDIKVTLTIANNTVTAVSIQNSEGNPESARFQEDFASEYKSYVVGKKVNDVQLSYVAGASDTTDGFNDALRQIRNQAQA